MFFVSKHLNFSNFYKKKQTRVKSTDKHTYLGNKLAVKTVINVRLSHDLLWRQFIRNNLNVIVI